MATRIISTKVAITGESEYLATMIKINSGLRTLQSELRLTENQFQGNANSIKALTEKGTALNNLHTAQSGKIKELESAFQNAQKAVEKYTQCKNELTEKIRANEEALNRLKNTTGDTSAEQAKLTAENKAFNEKLSENESYLDAAQKGVNNWQVKLNDAKVELNKLDTELQNNDKYLDEAKISADGTATSIDEFGKKVKTSAGAVDELTDETDEGAKALSEFDEGAKGSAASLNELQTVLVSAGVAKLIKEMADSLTDCAKASIEFESALTGVNKTTDLTSAELAAMSDDIKELATRMPVTTTELLNITEAAGQLGIKKENLLDFTEVMANLGVSTNLSSTEAASALAKFANVVKMSADDYDELGSVIVALGNNFATTERDIVSMATRLASSGAVVGLSEAEIMAVATALSSVGIEAEAGGSAISKLLKQIETAVSLYGEASNVIATTGYSLRDLELMASLSGQSFKELAGNMGLTTEELKGYMKNTKSLEQFADVSNMTAQEFISAWGENAVGALDTFISGLNDTERTGKSAIEILNQMGITEVRLSNAVLSLALSKGILTEALDTANSAWLENTALSREAELRYSTTESKLQMLSNAFNNVKVAIGDQLTPVIGEFAEAGTGALNWLSDFINRHEALVPVIIGVTGTLAVFTAGIAAYTAVSKIAELATLAFNLVLSASPVFLAATAIAALAAGIALFVAILKDDAIPSVKDLTTATRGLDDAFKTTEGNFDSTATTIGAATSIAEIYIKRLAELEEQGLDTAEAQDEYRLTVEKLNTVMPELNIVIDEQTGLIKGGTDALLDNVDALKKKALAEAAAVRYKDELEAWAAAALEVAENEQSLIQKKVESEQIQLNLNKAMAEFNELTDISADSIEANTVAADEHRIKVEELAFAIGDYQNQLSENNKQQNAYNDAIDQGKASLESFEDPLRQAKELVDDLSKSEEEAAGATDDFTTSQEEASVALENAKLKLTELAGEYYTAYEAAKKSIDGQTGLFGTFAAVVDKDTDTVEKMLGLMSTQVQNLSSYTENLEKAAKLGLDEGLVKSLADGSTTSAGYLATIIGKIEELGGSTEGLSEDAQVFVDSFNNKFAETSKARDELARTIAGIQTDLNDALQGIASTLSDADLSGFNEAVLATFGDIGVTFEAVGKDAASGLAAGIGNNTMSAQEKAEAMAAAAIEGVRLVFDSHSDSRVMIGIGHDFVSGLITGIGDKRDELTRLIDEIGKLVIRTSEDSAIEAVRRYTAEYEKINQETRTILQTLKTVIDTEQATLNTAMQTLGVQLVQGIVSGINSQSGSLYTTVKNLVRGAIAEANAAADVHSPSRETAKLGRNLALGIIEGVDEKSNSVRDSITNLIKNALSQSNIIASLVEKAAQNIVNPLQDAIKENAKAITYSAETNYAALMLEAKSLEEFLELASQRNAKIIGENIDLIAEGYATNEELLSSWVESSGNALNLTGIQLRDAVKAMAQEAQDAAQTTISAFENLAQAFSSFLNTIGSTGNVTYDADTNYAELMLEAKDTEEFLSLAAQRNAKIMGENINLVEKGYADNASLLSTWLTNTQQDIAKVTDVLTAALSEINTSVTTTTGGMVDGVDQKLNELKSLVTEKGGESAKGFDEAYAAIIDKSDKTTNDLVNRIKSSISTLPDDFNNTGVQMINGMVNGLNSQSGTLYSTISSIVSTAISQANTAAQIASPSKKTTETGVNLARGLIRGLELEQENVTQKMQSLMANVLKVEFSPDIEKLYKSARMPSLGIPGGSAARPSVTYKIENTYHIDALEVREEADVERVADVLYIKQERDIRRRGVRI